MSRNTHNKKWEEFKNVFGNVLECGDQKEAMRVLNGVKAGYSRSKAISPQKIGRINTISALIKFYK